MPDQKPTRVDITHKPVTSSQVATIGYDPASKTLAMTFKQKNGHSSEYQYPGVSQEQYDALASAESIGSHFGKHIKALPFHKFDPLPKAEPAAAQAGSAVAGLALAAALAMGLQFMAAQPAEAAQQPFASPQQARQIVTLPGCHWVIVGGMPVLRC